MTKTLFIPIDNSETHLIAALKTQNHHAQKKCYELHHKKLLGICYRYFNDEELAVEIMNDASITIFEKIHQFKEEGPFEGWIRRITVNICLNKIKSMKNLKK